MTATSTPKMTILYVDTPETSAHFYQQVFGVAPVEISATFGMFALPGGFILGLWSRHTVEPAASITGGGCELAIRADTAADVDDLHAQWQALGVPMLQAPTDMEFGRTFLATDPDGHRIRVFNPPA
ncbi:drug:proton antiporter [Agrobacterium vitis]|uniref:VOC family protein n=1 Tax=Agrobacterium vitis TaxID=373 RepID=UPI001F3324C6|nr:VOC family protein [Agrobacterium vitis]MCF1466285.1 drug:proton antiporter [Agrobacterium vitis]